jgi:hypothetical protein
MRELATIVARTEGKKTQARVGAVREIIATLSEVLADDNDALIAVVKNGARRLKRKK